MKTIVIGLGNPMLSDDGIGVKIAEQVNRSIKTQNIKDIDTIEASVGGLRLMELMVGYQRAIVIDAIQSKNGSKPGSFKKMTLDDLISISPTQHSTSAHDTNFITALEFGKEVGLSLPDKIDFFAIEVTNITDFSWTGTEAVTAVIPKVARAVLADLGLNPTGR